MTSRQAHHVLPFHEDLVHHLRSHSSDTFCQLVATFHPERAVLTHRWHTRCHSFRTCPCRQPGDCGSTSATAMMSSNSWCAVCSMWAEQWTGGWPISRSPPQARNCSAPQSVRANGNDWSRRLTHIEMAERQRGDIAGRLPSHWATDCRPEDQPKCGKGEKIIRLFAQRDLFHLWAHWQVKGFIWKQTPERVQLKQSWARSKD